MPGRTPRSKAFPPLFLLRAGECCARSPTRCACRLPIPPLFLLRAGECCPECGERTNAFALLASGLYDGVEDDTFNDFILLKDIEYLPKRLLALLTERCPGWRFDQEESSEPSCLMNHCLRCGAKLTDSYTHAEPGSAFYPTSPNECWNISVFLLPVEENVSLVCCYSSGGLTDWLDYDDAKPWKTKAAVV